MRLLAMVTEPKSIARYLRSLGEPPNPCTRMPRVSQVARPVRYLACLPDGARADANANANADAAR